MPLTQIKNIAKKGGVDPSTVDTQFKKLETKLKPKLIAAAKKKKLDDPEGYAYGTIMNMLKKKYEDALIPKTFDEYLRESK